MLRGSVVIVSRDRPGALGLCLTALAQSRHANFEVVAKFYETLASNE